MLNTLSSLNIGLPHYNIPRYNTDFNITQSCLGSQMVIFVFATSQVSYRFLALGCFPANLVSDVVCVLFVLRVGSLKG